MDISSFHNYCSLLTTDNSILTRDCIRSPKL